MTDQAVHAFLKGTTAADFHSRVSLTFVVKMVTLGLLG